MKFCLRVWLTVLTPLVGTESRNDPPFVDISFTKDIGVARVAVSDSGAYGVIMGQIGIFKKLWLLRCSRSAGERPLVRSILDSRPKKILIKKNAATISLPQNLPPTTFHRSKWLAQNCPPGGRVVMPQYQQKKQKKNERCSG